MATFVAYGSDVLRDVSISTNSTAGQDGAGQVTVFGGTSIFPDNYIIEFEVQNLLPNGEFDNATGFIGVTVYASQADYLAGTPTYTYTPQNPGQSAGLQNSLDGIGDTYVRFNANVLQSSDPGAPSLNSLFVSPGSNIANNQPMTIDHHTDVDYDGNSTIGGGTIEDGNGFFNVANSSAVCFGDQTMVLTPQGHKPILDLKLGERVTTADNGPQKIVWIGKRLITQTQMLSQPKVRPILIPKGILGAQRDTFVSRQHALLTSDGTLSRAVIMARRPRSRMRVANGRKQITYVHLMFETHQVIFANGICAESFYPGVHALRALSKGQLQSLQHVFPSLIGQAMKRPMHGCGDANVYGPTARPIAC